MSKYGSGRIGPICTTDAFNIGRCLSAWSAGLSGEWSVENVPRRDEWIWVIEHIAVCNRILDMYCGVVGGPLSTFCSLGGITYVYFHG